MAFILPPGAKIVFHQKTEISVGEKVFLREQIDVALPSGAILSYDSDNFPDDLEWFSGGAPGYPVKISPRPLNPFQNSKQL